MGPQSIDRPETELHLDRFRPVQMIIFNIAGCHCFLGDLRWVARFGLMSQIGASQIEAPIGSLFQKYVSSSFIVKMRIDLGS